MPVSQIRRTDRILIAGLSVLVPLGVTTLPQLPAIAEPPTDGGGSIRTDQLREDLRRIIDIARDRVFPALINIHVVTVSYWNGKEQKGRSVGSGTIISREGHVITNQHVTHQGKKFKCTLSDKQEISARLIGEDPLTDLAVIQLDLSELRSPASNLPVAQFGDSDKLQVGDYVMAMGSPLALSRSVTLGIVSNTERVFTGSADDDDMELEEGQRTGLFTRWIQHDALIHPGNSGGPLVNLTGEIVGINELGGNSIGFAIPSNLAKGVVQAMIRDREVARSWVGVSFKPIEKTGFDQGVLVNSVVQGSPAEKAGIEAGDVLLRMNGQAVTVRFPEEVPPLMKRIADLPVGGKVKFDYLRAGRTLQAEVTTDKMQKDRGDEAALRSWGLTIEELTDKLARDYRLEKKDGVLISSVRTGGPAQIAEPPISGGDILRSIDSTPIHDVAGVIAAYEKIMASNPLPEYLLVEFERAGQSQVTLLKPKPDEDEPPPREVAKAWIGVATQPIVDKLAKKLGHPEDPGFRVTRVYPRTNAAESGLKVGDIIVRLNGEKLRPRGMQDSGLLNRTVRKLKIEDPATLSILRGGREQDVKLTLERTRLTPEEARKERNNDFELTVRELTFFDRDENRWGDTVKGVLIVQVEPAGWAGLGGLKGGDLIQRIDDQEIKGLKSFKAAMETITRKQPERVVFRVLRGAQTRFQFVEPEWKPSIKEDRKQPAGKDSKP